MWIVEMRAECIYFQFMSQDVLSECKFPIHGNKEDIFAVICSYPDIGIRTRDGSFVNSFNMREMVLT